MACGPNLDVGIIGGGMAGGLLARQLARTHPGLCIGLFDRDVESGFRVGESMVEIASHYFIRRLGLSSYLYESHLPKNGLRFFFDTPERDAALHEMTEVGSEALPFHPAFQIDRARLDADLLDMAATAGVQVRRGVAVKRVELGSGGEPHHFDVSDAGGSTRLSARWLVDASGRNRLLARKLGLGTSEAGHAISAVWARLEGVADVDDSGPDSFRARVRYTTRRLSTLHFLYPGYWIWMIPLRGGITSVGVVGLPAVLERCRSRESFVEFLREHRAIGSLLREAKLIDFLRYRQLAYGTRQFFSADRWGLTGEAGAFADPLYSPGADFIALENDYLTDLIGRDLAGEEPGALAERAELFDAFTRFRHDAVMHLYRDLYPILGSWQLAKLKWDLDIASYYNLWLSPYVNDQHLDPDFLRRQLAQRPFVLAAMQNFAELFRTLERELRTSGRYFAGNLGGYSDGRECLEFMTEIGRPRSDKRMLQCTGDTFNRVRLRALEVRDGTPESGEREPKPLGFYTSPRPLI